MSTTLSPPDLFEGEQGLVLHGIGWDQYVTINDALPGRRGLRMVYINGSLTLLTLSRRHDRFADQIDAIVKAVASGLGIAWEVAGSATLRRAEKEVGVEGDRTYYFGDHAELMGGPIDIDLATQPPPDLAIEIEVSHPADQSIATYARLGVPEVWRFQARRWSLTFLSLGEDGAYHSVARSRHLSGLTPEDAIALLRIADENRVFSRWSALLDDWVRLTFLPRSGGG